MRHVGLTQHIHVAREVLHSGAWLLQGSPLTLHSSISQSLGGNTN